MLVLLTGFNTGVFNSGVSGFCPHQYCRTYQGHSHNCDQTHMWLHSWPSGLYTTLASLNCTEWETSPSLPSGRRSEHLLQANHIPDVTVSAQRKEILEGLFYVLFLDQFPETRTTFGCSWSFRDEIWTCVKENYAAHTLLSSRSHI